MNLTFSNHPDRSACVRIAGDLDYVTTDTVVEAVSRLFVEQPELRLVRLDCSELSFCDSAGLSGLLQLHRLASGAGIRLHLEARPPHLDRILAITGTIEHLTASRDGEGAAESADSQDLSGAAEMADTRGERNA